MRYRVNITLLSPTALALRRATGNDIETLSYIPGVTLRGALAAAYLSANGAQSNDDFKALFLDERARFGDARPAGVHAWPLSARCCAEYGPAHRVVDRLLAEAARTSHSKKCGRQDGATGAPCEAKWTLPDSLMRPEWDKEVHQEVYRQYQVRRRRVAHAQIDARVLRTRTGQFYSLQSMEAGELFEADIRVSKHGASVLKNLDQAELRIGRGGSRGLGRVRLTVWDAGAPQIVEAGIEVKNRIAELNEAAKSYQALANWTVFSVTLRSPALLVNDAGLAKSWIEGRDIGLDDYELLAWFSSQRRIAGWNAAVDLPKRTAMAIAEGSCFLFGRHCAPDDASRLAETTTRLEENGIGERLMEGFGEVVCCDQFHAKAGTRT